MKLLDVLKRCGDQLLGPSAKTTNESVAIIPVGPVNNNEVGVNFTPPMIALMREPLLMIERSAAPYAPIARRMLQLPFDAPTSTRFTVPVPMVEALQSALQDIAAVTEPDAKTCVAIANRLLEGLKATDAPQRNSASSALGRLDLGAPYAM